jgi:hypothetical protein
MKMFTLLSPPPPFRLESNFIQFFGVFSFICE